MNNTVEWLVSNKEWLFSGIGITILGIIFKIIYAINQKEDNVGNIFKIQKNGNILTGNGNTINYYASDIKENVKEEILYRNKGENRIEKV